jgi:hypothetical protein
VFFYGDDEYLNTTIGQLNFFKWAIGNNILEFIATNVDYLEDCMNTFQKNTKNDKTCKRDNTIIDDDLSLKDEADSIGEHHRIKIKSSSALVSFD